MNIQQCRIYFKVLNFVTPTIRKNFKSDKKFRAEKFICTDCYEEEDGSSENTNDKSGLLEVQISSRKYRGYSDSQTHQIQFCQANADLREGKNILENEIDCVTFFQQLLQRRMNKLS